jgi:ABC-2 type transport system ATP-binding protein
MSPGQVSTGHVSADQENASQESAAPGARQEAGPGAEPAAGAGAAPAAEPTPAIVTSGLTKRFRSGQLAVDGLDMVVPRGSVYGFLGPNGSGKTTTIRMLLGLVYPTQGSHSLLGVPMPSGTVQVLPRVGSLVEGPAFYPQLSGPDNLARVDAADRTADPRTAKQRVTVALDRVGLLAAKKKHYRAYSLGMKQRLAIAASLLQPRELIILDEPTNGLDPQGTREVRGLIREIATDGITVLVSSHLLAEVEQICTQVGVMRTGKLVFQGPLEELRARGVARIRVTTTDPTRAAEVLGKLGLADVTAGDGEASAALGGQAPEQVTRELVYAGVPVAGLDTPRPSLEELFVGLTGEGFDVDG